MFVSEHDGTEKEHMRNIFKIPIEQVLVVSKQSNNPKNSFSVDQVM